MSEHTPLTEAEQETLGIRDADCGCCVIVDSLGLMEVLAARTSTATADTEYVWKRNDQADHDAGHPSGYDCDGDALSGSEACGHRYAATADTRLRARVEALADEMTAYEDEYDPTSAGVTRVWGRRIRALLDATAAPTGS